MYTQSYNSTNDMPMFKTYPNHDAIMDMARKKLSISPDTQNNLQAEEHNQNAEQDENLIMLILTLLLTPDIDSSGIEYLLAALMFIL